ncbi:MAG TPA: hypothetical protein VFI53_00415 [Myxococcaceae bacterium]|nr:hypothetical protein [Myxococcaceae bacterium]
MRHALIVLLALSLPAAVVAQEREGHEKSEAGEAAKVAELAPALKGAKVSLAAGLQAAGKEGRPISGKFELEDGKLQLSVYTTKNDKFSEVIVDHQTGKVAKSEAITGGEDLAAAQKQAQAMAKTKQALRDVIAKAEKANPGFHAVSVIPEIEDGKARADVTLLKGTASKSVDEPL